MNKTETEIELSSKAKNKPLYFALFMGAISIIAIQATSTLPGMPMGLAILFITLYVFNKNLKVFKFSEKHFVFQVGILGKTNVPYSALKSYEVVKKNIVITYQNPNKKEKKIRLPISQIEPTQFSLFENTLKSKISN
ncbi:hypothetical protein ACFFVB_12445 [Formosa undariae]|uniref:PH domain-containing protein n=1 Tax=Formosa undariae TaxID=1325436 RepID=A0ABV5F368_9FLAO